MADIVKSVEFVEVDTTGETVSQDLTKGQDYTNCVPFVSNHGGQDYIDTKLWDCYFSGTTESGTINFERWNGRSTAGYIKCFVVEFYPDEVYVEQGEFTLSSDDYIEVTTSGVFNPERTGMIHHWYCSDGNNFNASRTLVRGRVTASGILDFHRASTAANILNGHWYIFEAKKDQFTVSHKSFSNTSAGVADFTGTSHDMLRTFVIASNSGGYTANLYPDRSVGYVNFSNRDCVEWHKASAYNTCNVAYQAIEFQDDRIHVPYKGNVTLGSTIPITVTWDSEGRTSVPVDFNYAMVINTCNLDWADFSSIATGVDSLSSSVKFTGVSGIQLQKNSHYRNTISSIFVVDWQGYEVTDSESFTLIDPELSFVKSVQNATIITTAKTNFTPLLRNQVPKNSVIFSSQHATTTANNPYNYMHDTYISDANVVVAHRAGTSSDGVSEVSVVEFYPDQVRVQKGTVRGDESVTPELLITLEHTIVPDRSFLLMQSSSRSSTNNWTYHNIRHRIVDENTIGFYGIQSNNTNHITWSLVEDITEDNSCFESFHWTDSGGLTTARGISGERHFPYYNTFLLASMAGGYNGPEYIERGCCRSYYYSPNMPQMIQNADNHNTRYYSGQAVKIRRNGQFHTHGYSPSFSSGNLQITDNVLPTSWSGIEDITVYNNTALSYARASLTTQDATGAVFCSIRIVDYDSLTLQVSRGQSGYTVYPSFNIICWPGAPYVPPQENVPTRSMIRSIAKYSIDGSRRIYTWPLDKGQLPENCVPFATWSVDGTRGTDDCHMCFDLHKAAAGQQHVTMTRGGVATSASTVQVYVAEFDDEQIRVQSGTYGIAGGTADFTITIDEVNLDKAFLLFYNSVEGNQNWTKFNVSGRFQDSTTLRFIRTDSGNSLFISWYVVECLQDQWRVQHIYYNPAAASLDYYASLDYAAGPARRWVFCSYAGGYGGTQYTERNSARYIARTDHNLQINRADAHNNIYHINFEVVEFSRKLDMRVLWEDPSTSSTTATYDNTMNSEPPLEESRMLVFNSMVNNKCRNNGTTHDSCNAEAFFLCELIDFDIGDPKFRVTKHNTALSTYGNACITEVPPFNKYYMEGYTKERGNPVPREVRAYRSSTGELVDTTMSVSGTGYFFVETKYSDEHYVICLDDEAVPDYNNLIYSRIYPTVISGTFAYHEGLVTTSGIPEGIPLGRL
jgi:hypothetical protein